MLDICILILVHCLLPDVLITAFLFASDCRISWFLARDINLPFYGPLMQDGFFYITVMDHLNGSFAYAGLPLDHDIFIFPNTFGWFIVNTGFGRSIGIMSKTNTELSVNIYFMCRGIKHGGAILSSCSPFLFWTNTGSTSSGSLDVSNTGIVRPVLPLKKIFLLRILVIWVPFSFFEHFSVFLFSLEQLFTVFGLSIEISSNSMSWKFLLYESIEASNLS